MMVFVGETNSGLVRSWRKVTGPRFCQLLELLEKGRFLSSNGLFSLYSISGLQETSHLTYC